MVHGERLEEIIHWHKMFCLFYIDAHDNPDYKFAYHAFRRQISFARQNSENHQYTASQLRSAFWLLTTVNFLSKNAVGRLLFKTALRVRRRLVRIVHAVHNDG